MNIAVASGKGGTGKTTIATNLSTYLSEHNNNICYLDCDVEEPNGHLFLKPQFHTILPANIPVPSIDETKCNSCGECVRFCEYRALVRLGKMVMVFSELCHGCGGCTLLCSQLAITEVEKQIGVVEAGFSGNIKFVHGRLNIGEAMSPPLIRKVLEQATKESINIIDAPPGTSCPVIASIRNADFVVLVTEPTPFGLNDLGLALDMVRELGVPHGVVINRAETGNSDAQEFCQNRQVGIIAEILEERNVAEAYSRGEMIVKTVPGLHGKFAEIWTNLQKQVRL